MSSEDQVRKEAQKFIKEADENLKINKSSFFGLFSSGPNYYEAIEAYNRAGNIYKSAKLCKLGREWIWIMKENTWIYWIYFYS